MSDLVTIEKLSQVLNFMETLFPRHKTPQFIWMNKRTFDALKERIPFIISFGTPRLFDGLPVYLKQELKDGEVKIYNLNNEIMSEFNIRMDSDE